MSADFDIEVYEWPEGAPRPRRPKDALAIIELPERGTAPAIGDRISLMVRGGLPADYEVVGRTHLCGSTSDRADGKAEWWKMWIFVRELP